MKFMPLISPNDPRYPRSTSVLEMNEWDSKGGRIDREIEFGLRYVGEEMEHDEHKKFSTEGKQFHFINNICSSLTIVPFIG